jgi:hypothetical protein
MGIRSERCPGSGHQKQTSGDGGYQPAILFFAILLRRRLAVGVAIVGTVLGRYFHRRSVLQ